MAKLIPQLVRKFDFELSDPKTEWKTSNHWFVKQTGLDYYVKNAVKTHAGIRFCQKQWVSESWQARLLYDFLKRFCSLQLYMAGKLH